MKNEVMIQNEKYLKENPKSTIVPAPGEPKISREYRVAVYAIEDRLREDEPAPGCGKSVLTDFFPLKHSFAEGVYQRELTVPKGMMLVTFLHRDSYFSWLVKGEATVFTEEGGKRVKGPLLITSPRGAK